MKVLAAILFFIVFVAIGNCQAKENPINSNTQKTLLISTNHTGISNAVIMDDEWLDTQETNDLAYSFIACLPDLFNDSQKLEICGIVPDTYEIQRIFYSPLFLDLPPPVISV